MLVEPPGEAIAFAPESRVIVKVVVSGVSGPGSTGGNQSSTGDGEGVCNRSFFFGGGSDTDMQCNHSNIVPLNH